MNQWNWKQKNNKENCRNQKPVKKINKINKYLGVLAKGKKAQINIKDESMGTNTDLTAFKRIIK